MFRLAIIASSLLFAASAAQADVTGVWLTADGDAHVRMAKCGPAICGTIVWLKDPKDANGKPLTDVNNFDPAKQKRPLLGLQIATDFRPSATEPGKFEGEFYNADDGNSYQGKISAPNGKELAVQGCFGAFCQTQIWHRVK